MHYLGKYTIKRVWEQLWTRWHLKEASLTIHVILVFRIHLPQVFHTVHILRHSGGYVVITEESNGTIRYSFGPIEMGIEQRLKFRGTRLATFVYRAY